MVFTVYLKSDGTVWTLGANGFGQLGDGTTTNRSNPVQVKNADGTGLSEVVAISADYLHTVYLKSDGTGWAAGSNGYGQLGDGTTTNRSNPVQVTHADSTGLSEVIGISAAKDHTVYLKSDGTVRAAGYNSSGRLGDGTTMNRSNPVQVAAPTDFNEPFGAPKIKSVSVGDWHTLMLTTEGTVYGSGANGGQLPDGTTESRSIFKAIENTDGSILTGVRDAQAKWDQSVFLMEDGTALTAGGNWKGALGDGTMTAKSSLVQVQNSDGTAFSDIKSVALNCHSSHYLKSDGTVWSTGWNTDGRLGDGTTTDRTNPVQVVNADGSPFTDVAKMTTGSHHLLFIKSDGSLGRLAGVVMVF